MFIRIPEAHGRSLMKAISWRIVGSIDTFVISFFVTGKLKFALSISIVETFTKIVIYYGHERFWEWVPWGRAGKQPTEAPQTTSELTRAPTS